MQDTQLIAVVTFTVKRSVACAYSPRTKQLKSNLKNDYNPVFPPMHLGGAFGYWYLLGFSVSTPIAINLVRWYALEIH